MIREYIFDFFNFLESNCIIYILLPIFQINFFIFFIRIIFSFMNKACRWSRRKKQCVKTSSSYNVSDLYLDPWDIPDIEV